MNATQPMRPHFSRPPIHEQAIALGFERLPDFDIVDHGLFWNLIKDQFPQADTAARLPEATELFEGSEGQVSFTVVPPALLSRSVFKNAMAGELLQLQDNMFAFNWIRENPEVEYPRFERTSARLWDLYDKYVEYFAGRYGRSPSLRQCEITNVNIIPIQEFGKTFDALDQIFIVDPFEWRVPGLTAETYERRRQHKIVGEDGAPIGRLHSVIAPVFGQSGEQLFKFELTARSAPAIRSKAEAVAFFNVAHNIINGAFLASVTTRAREHWGEYDGK